MTPDEQELMSFRYIAPRIMILSSGNVAIIPMVGGSPATIVTPSEFDQFWRNHIPTMDQLETTQRDSEARQRTWAASLSAPTVLRPSLDDLA